MKSLNTLIRQQKQKVDELRRKFGALENQKQQLIKRSEALAEELKREVELAAETPEMGGFFGDFADRIKKRRGELALEMAKLEKQLQALVEEVRLAFSELKKFEIVRDKRLEEMRKKRDQQEAEQLDEVAIIRAARTIREAKNKKNDTPF
jgi:flagellar export protein FliJ